MWYLKSSSDNRILYVLPTKEISIGRSIDSQVCNFAIADASISRKHAILSVSDNSLFVQDLGSTYGTFINDSAVKIQCNNNIELKNNDVIKFGKMGSVWQVQETSLVTCTSTLKGENLQTLRACLGKLGALLKNEWDDTCTYLTMPAITLTIKVVLALAQGSYIVTPEYWTKCLEAVNSHTMLPVPDNFTPQIIESTLNKENVSFLPNAERKMIFAGKTIIFFSKRQLEMYKTILLKCSAIPQLLSEAKMSNAMLAEHQVIVIQYNISSTSPETQAQKNQITEIIDYLKSKGKRVVADAEIGLAILYCSLNKYCNPDFNFTSEVIKQPSAPITKTGNILAPESQLQTNVLTKKENVIINESLSSTSTTGKRKLSEENVESEVNANKKLAIGAEDITSSSNNESGKRKYPEDMNGASSVNKKMAIDNEEIFNFKSTDNTKVTEKKLFFSKPGRKEANTEDEDLFNFVQDKNSEDVSARNNKFDINRANNIKQEINNTTTKTGNIEEEYVDLSALRGSKLKELQEQDLNWNSDDSFIRKIKKEDPDDLDNKMHNLDLGAPVLILKPDLIKREPFSFVANESHNGTLKNFKTFKKAGFVKRQEATVSKPAMSLIIASTPNNEQMNSMSY